MPEKTVIPIPASSDPAYRDRLTGARLSALMKTKSTKLVDAGKQPIDDSPLFGGSRQSSLLKQPIELTLDPISWFALREEHAPDAD